MCAWVQASWWGASSISMRKVSMGVSPMSLKKNRCSRHLRPMERRAGRRSSSLANLRWTEGSERQHQPGPGHTLASPSGGPQPRSPSHRPCCSGYFCLQ